MNTSFTKMHGLGNDFIVIDATRKTFHVDRTTIKALADRHTGIGFDQLLIIEPSNKADFFCRIFNADGSEAEQCGNGLRCVARFIHEEKLHPQSSFSLETKSGVYPIQIDDYRHIKVTMGTPEIQETLIELPISSETPIAASILSFGNPHTVIKVASIETAPIQQLGSVVSTHPYFPTGTNVGFMQIITPTHIRLRTFERGAGETYACGSNACAAAMAGILNGWLRETVTVEFKLGSLQIEWDMQRNVLHMTGPAERVFEGVI